MLRAKEERYQSDIIAPLLARVERERSRVSPCSLSFVHLLFLSAFFPFFFSIGAQRCTSGRGASSRAENTG